MTQAADADAFVDSLVGELTRHPVNSNRFFQTFLTQRLAKSQLQEWLGQYHYFCKQFVKVLEGLLSRTPVDELEMRIREAARYVPLERLALSAQCGFATSVLGNAHRRDQRPR